MKIMLLFLPVCLVFIQTSFAEQAVTEMVVGIDKVGAAFERAYQVKEESRFESKGLPSESKGLANRSSRNIALPLEFDFDSDRLSNNSRAFLQRVASAITTRASLADTQLLIQGHADSTGAAEYNQRLSQRRADAVRRFLIRQGVASYRLVSRGYGEHRPLCSNHNEYNRAVNRRVEFSYIIHSGEEPTPASALPGTCL